MTKQQEAMLRDGVVSVAQAAIELHISKTHLYDLLRSGAITHTTVGTRVLIPRAAISAYLAKRMTIGSVA